MKKNKFRPSLGIRLILSYLIIIVIPIIIFAVIEFRRFESRNIQDAMTKNKYALDLELVNLQKKKELMESTAQMILSNSDLMNALHNFSKMDERALVAFNQGIYREIMQIQYSNPSISEINIFLRNNNITEIWPLIIKDSRIRSKEWFRETMKHDNSVYWDMHFEHESVFDIQYETSKHSDAVVALCRPVHYTKSKILGILRVNMLLNDFFSKVYEDVKDEESQMYIVDSTGEIHSNDRSAFSEKIGINSLAIRRSFEENLKKNRSSFLIDDGSSHLVGIYRKLDYMNCYLINVTSINAMKKNINQSRNTSILGILFLISIVFGLTYFTTMRILKKLYLIIQSMKKIQNGDFDVDIPVRGNDEIGELAHHFRKMLRKIDELITEAADKKTTTKEAELRALKTQIDAHFIYNVIENIKMMAEIDGKYEISDSLTSLGSMMRYNLKWKSEFVPLRDEIEHIKNYITLINIRFDNKIKLELEVEPELYKHEILKISLQPLVENSVKHGFVNMLSEREGVIDLKITRKDRVIQIMIRDNGKGMSVEQLEALNHMLSADAAAGAATTSATTFTATKNGSETDLSETISKAATAKGQSTGSGIGIQNVNERLKLYYGSEAVIAITSEKFIHTTIIMTIPY